MRISIIVPTCPAQGEDTFSPKSALSYRYQGQDDYTISTRCSSDSSLVSEEEYASHTRGNTHDGSDHSRNIFTPDEELRENVYGHPVPAPSVPMGEASRNSTPLSVNNNIYNTLVIGQPSKLDSGNGGMEGGDKFRFPTPTSYHSNMNHSASAAAAVLPSRGTIGNHVMYDQCAPSQDDVYQRLVVGAGTITTTATTPIRQMPSLQSPSFQSLESNYSRHVVYQAQSYGTNRHWDPQASLPADITEEEEEEDEEEAENEILAMIESGEMYRAWVVAPLMMAAATLCLGMDDATKLDPRMSKQSMVEGRIRRPNKAHSSIQNISCAAESIEKDLLSMIRFNMLGGNKNKRNSGAGHDDDDDDDIDDDDVDNEDDIPITRLSADLRKQRLRNQVLSYERDTMNQENNQLRERLSERDAEIKALQLQVQELTNRTKKAEDEAMERGVKLAQMMNEFLDSQT